MKFYNREKELALLQKIETRSQKSAQMTFVVGRRRNETCVYMFIAKNNEALLFSELVEDVEKTDDTHPGKTVIPVHFFA